MLVSNQQLCSTYSHSTREWFTDTIFFIAEHCVIRSYRMYSYDLYVSLQKPNHKNIYIIRQDDRLIEYYRWRCADWKCGSPVTCGVVKQKIRQEASFACTSRAVLTAAVMRETPSFWRDTQEDENTADRRIYLYATLLYSQQHHREWDGYMHPGGEPSHIVKVVTNINSMAKRKVTHTHSRIALNPPWWVYIELVCPNMQNWLRCACR